MQQNNNQKLAAVLTLFMVGLVPTAAADDPDATVPLVPAVDESTPEESGIEETCDPLELIICVGPFAEPLPAVVTVTIDEWEVAVWTHAGETEPTGPFYNNVTNPATGNEIPVTLCPNTCPVPVPPETELAGGLTVCYLYNGTEECVGPITLEDRDGDGTSDVWDPLQGTCIRGIVLGLKVCFTEEGRDEMLDFYLLGRKQASV